MVRQRRGRLGGARGGARGARAGRSTHIHLGLVVLLLVVAAATGGSAGVRHRLLKKGGVGLEKKRTKSLRFLARGAG